VQESLTVQPVPGSSMRPKPRYAFMAMLGALIGWLGMLGAFGNGWSPLLFIVIGLIAGPLLESIFVKTINATFKRARRRLAVLLGIGLGSLGLARYSVTIDPVAAFVTATRITLPTGVTKLRAWQQWYDGPNLVLAFNSDQPSIDAILAVPGRHYEQSLIWDEYPNWDAEKRRQWLNSRMLIPFFDSDRMRMKEIVRPQQWQQQSQPPNSRTVVCWDPPTQQVIMCWWGG
jgi:hypothetical protein